MKAIKAGCGYWNTTRYPRGGDFRRAKEPMPFTIVRIVDTYNDGTPREYVGRLANGETVCVDAQACCDYEPAQP